VDVAVDHTLGITLVAEVDLEVLELELVEARVLVVWVLLEVVLCLVDVLVVAS